MDLERKLEAAEKDSAAPVRPDAYPAGSEVGKAWEAAAEAIYYWDEQIQDGLGVSAELLAAYQLGRGLAEAFWALDPDAPEPDTKPTVASTLSPPHPGSWEFLLGPRRQQMLGAYLGLLEGAFAPLTGSAVRGPLTRWCALVGDKQVRNRSEAALVALRGQLHNWRDVLLGSRDPISFAKGFGLKLAFRQALRVAQTLPLETFLAARRDCADGSRGLRPRLGHHEDRHGGGRLRARVLRSHRRRSARPREGASGGVGRAPA